MKILAELILAIPSVIKFLMELKKFVDFNFDWKERNKFIDDLKAHLKKARETGDHSELESFLSSSPSSVRAPEAGPEGVSDKK